MPIDEDQVRQNLGKIADPEEFMRLLKQFGEEAFAAAEARGRAAAVSEMIGVVQRHRMPLPSQRRLINQLRDVVGNVGKAADQD